LKVFFTGLCLQRYQFFLIFKFYKIERLLVLLAIIVSITSCTKEEQFLPIESTEELNKTRALKQNSTAQAIVLAAPSVNNTYYQSVFQDIVDFQVDYANAIDGRDEVWSSSL